MWIWILKCLKWVPCNPKLCSWLVCLWNICCIVADYCMQWVIKWCCAPVCPCSKGMLVHQMRAVPKFLLHSGKTVHIPLRHLVRQLLGLSHLTGPMNNTCFLSIFLTILLLFLSVVQSTVPDLREGSFWTMFPPGRLALNHAQLHHFLSTLIAHGLSACRHRNWERGLCPHGFYCTGV